MSRPRTGSPPTSTANFGYLYRWLDDTHEADELARPGVTDPTLIAIARLINALLPVNELREIARGIHPAVLAKGGLPLALNALARRSPVPVDLRIRADGRLPEPVEISAYYLVAEALTNAAKHACASAIGIEAEVVGDLLRVAVRDDGVGAPAWPGAAAWPA